MADTEQFKVSLIADARDVEDKIIKTRAKLKTFTDKANKDAQIRIKINIANLERELRLARVELRKFQKEGNKAGEIRARLRIQGLQDSVRQSRKVLRGLQKEADTTEKSFFSLNGIVRDGLKAFGAIEVIRRTARFFKEASETAREFELAFTGVRKTVEGTPEQLEKLRGEFENLSKQIPISFVELARIGELAGQLGIARDDIIDFTKTIAQLGVTTNLSTEEAATSLARFQNIVGSSTDQIDNIASSIVGLGNNFATTEKEIVDFALRIAGAGNIVGLTEADILAIATAFSSVGIEAQAGGTAVQKSLLVINEAVNTGGIELSKFAKVAGLTSSEFQKLWETNAAKAFNRFVEGLGRSGDDAGKILEDLVAGDVRLQRAFLSLANAGDLLSRTIELSNEEFDKANALAEEFAKFAETDAAKLQILNNRFDKLKVIAGEALNNVIIPALNNILPVLEQVVGGISEAISAFGRLGEAAGNFFAGFGFRNINQEAFGKQQLFFDTFNDRANELRDKQKELAEVSTESGKAQAEAYKTAEKALREYARAANLDQDAIVNGSKKSAKEAEKIRKELIKVEDELRGTAAGKILTKNIENVFGSVNKAIDSVKNLGKEVSDPKNQPSFDPNNESRDAIDESTEKLDEYISQTEKVANSTERLAEKTAKYYEDIEKSIAKALDKQKEVAKELEDFNKTETERFAEKTAERDFELSEKEKEIREEISELKASEIDDIKDIKNAEEELNKVIAERAEIKKFVEGGLGEGGDGTFAEAFKKASELAAKSEFEQSRASFQEKLSQKQEEVQAEIDKQQQIIDIQNRFAEIQEATDAKSISTRRKLFQIATGARELEEEELSKFLEDAGFKDLSREQELEILKQVERARGLEVERNQVEQQLDELLQAKEEHFKLAEELHAQSVDNMVEKTDDLIEAIKRAQLEQIRLNQLRGKSSSGSTTNTTTVNVNNNINGDVDLESANRILINKINQ